MDSRRRQRATREGTARAWRAPLALAAAAAGVLGAAVFSLAGGGPPAGGEPGESIASPAAASMAQVAPGAGAILPAALEWPRPVSLEAALPGEWPPGGPAPGAAASDDLSQSIAEPRAGTEAAHYERYLALGRSDADGLSAAAERLFAGPAPLNARVAMLRALWDSGSADAATWFLVALDVRGERVGPEAALPDFAVRFLSERAPRESAARQALSDYLAAAGPACDNGRVARAAAAIDGARTPAPHETP